MLKELKHKELKEIIKIYINNLEYQQKYRNYKKKPNRNFEEEKCNN